MKTNSSRRKFIQSGIILPAAGFVIPQLNLQAAIQQPNAKLSPQKQGYGHPDTGKYGKYVLKEPYATHHQMEDVTVLSPELMAPCIITHQVFFKLDTIVKEPMAHDFVQILGFIGTNPMDCREFDAEVEFYLGEEKEKHIIKTPTVVSCVAGLMHGPIVITKIGKPFIFLEVMLTNEYALQKPKA
jgi:hypothetical protein